MKVVIPEFTAVPRPDYAVLSLALGLDWECTKKSVPCIKIAFKFQEYAVNRLADFFSEAKYLTIILNPPRETLALVESSNWRQYSRSARQPLTGVAEWSKPVVLQISSNLFRYMVRSLG